MTLRLQWSILRRLADAQDGLSVSEICEALNIPRRTAYHQLAKLREAGFPIYSERGRWYVVPTTDPLIRWP